MNEIIYRLRQIYNETRRRFENNKIFRYNTGEIVHKKQLEFHKSPARNRWVFGGNRSGKTECGAVEAIFLARGIHPYRKNKPSVSGWVVSLSTQVQRDVAQKKILEYLNPDWIEDIAMLSGKKDNPEGGVIDYITIKNIFGSVSRIGFKSCDQGREKFQGMSLDFVWFDEEPPQDVYVECRMRVMDKCGDIFATMTPLKGLTFVYNEIYMNTHDPEIWCMFMEWNDNPYLDKNEIMLMENALGADELDTRRSGKFSTALGLVYNDFSPLVHVVEPFAVPHEWYDNISIDPGLKNPLSCHFYAVDFDDNIYVIYEHYEAGRDVAFHAEKIKQIADKLNWPRLSNGSLSALIDSAANQRTLASTKSVVELFLEYGITVNPNVNKDLFSGINRVKSYLKTENGPRLFIFNNCVNLIREFKGYFWGLGDSPVKKDDHALDELRYYIMSRPENRKQNMKTMVQKHKEQLYRKIKRQKL
ncbi:MAG: terminase family protein [Christensenellaceae bacterium]|jgi:phage terminase large subunit-like protein|nr:terminase family protein [Christensenellaceae bacterium]